MKFAITSVWRDEYEYREIETLADLLAFQKECGYPVILSEIDPDSATQPETGVTHELEIYDDYRE